MSRFFRAGSDSESESESSDDGVQDVRPIAPARAMQFSDDEEETRRVVRSEKDKRYDEILTIVKQLKNHKKIKDFANVLTDFEGLIKAFEKARKVVDKEGVPRFYIKTLVELEDFINECWEDREWRKTISKNNSKGLSTVRQKIKKYNRDFETDITTYKANPDAGDDDVDDDEDFKEAADEESEEEPPKPVVKRTEDKPAKVVKPPADDDDDDDSNWGSDESEESSSSDDEMPAMGKLTAEYFLKSTTEQEAQRREERKREKRLKKEEKDGKKKDDDEEEWQEVMRGAPSQIVVEKPKMFAKDQEITVEAVVKKLNEIIAMRGKKGTDRSVMIDMLRELKQIAETNNLGQPIAVKICFNIMAAIYDYNPNIATCMKTEMWENSCLPTIQELLNTLVENSDIDVGENILEESEQLDKPPYRIRGCILTMVERLDEEFTKMLQACDAHSTEFVERLKDEQAMCDIINKLEKYLEKIGSSEEVCRIYLRKIEHLYYKFDPTDFGGSEKQEAAEKSSQALMDKMCKFIYAKDSTDRLRTRAMLCHIYHHALHDRWYQARDLMLMSHLQDNIQHSDVSTQILYNRTLVQLGLCGFRQGHIRDAHNALVDIQSSNRAKELLAQGLVPQRQHERSPEQEKIEKRRLLPYHKHINLELLECVYLVSAMLLEIPYMAAHELDVRKRMISKNFHHVLKMSERQTLTGPPESMREHVVAASKAMKNGDWKKCRDYIINEKMNAKVWDLFFQADKVRDMISAKIQEESLRTYLFRYSSLYDSLSLDSLAAMFKIDSTLAHATISKMIINEELMASLDEPTQIVVMHRTEPTRLQSLALQLSEKVGSLVDNNERIMEIKQGNFFFNKSNQRDNFQNQNQQQQQWGGRGGRQHQQRNNPQQQRAY